MDATAETIGIAGEAVSETIAAWKTSGDVALEHWKGPHAELMVEEYRLALSQAAGLASALYLSRSQCNAFPNPFSPGPSGSYQQQGLVTMAALTAPDPDGAVGARPQDLRDFAITLRSSSSSFAVRASAVNYDQLSAMVTVGRPLTADEREQRIDDGADPASLDDVTIAVTQSTPVEELITLVAPDDQATEARTRAQATAEFITAVADAIEAADSTRLDLLAVHPELAHFLVTGGMPDVLAGDTAVAVLQAYFEMVDTAADGGDPDDNVSRDDLEAIAADPNAPPELRAAAQYLLDNPTLYGLVDTGADDRGPGYADGDISRGDIDGFLEAQGHFRALEGWVDELDTAAHGGDPDGYVSRNDLEAAVEDMSLPQAVRDAARYLLDHDGAFRSVADQEELGATPWAPFGGGGFTATDLIGRLVNGQAYVHDPEAARNFVIDLPVADDGGQGLPVTLSGDDSVRALAGAALFATGGDLTETQAVVAHLPESPGAVRNQLITAYYDMLAQRVDGVMTDAWGVPGGNPAAPGSGGANWLIYAPWASSGVRSVIDGSFSVFGIGPTGAQTQAAADGNQWIFNDITARFAAFVELFEDNGGSPTDDQVEAFFLDNFDDGDAEIRAGFEAYLAAMTEPDDARRQTLMFQGNTLVATHEQAGAQPYLEVLTDIPGPWNEIASEYIDLQVGDHALEVNRDLDIDPDGSNLLIDQPILGLDPDGVDFGGPDLPDISGWGDDGFDTSTQTWNETDGTRPEIIYVDPHSGYPVVVDEAVDPDATLDGTAASDWAGYNDRMWFIHRMFEQTHTDPSLYDTSWIYGDDGPGIDVDFLPDEVQDWVERP